MRLKKTRHSIFTFPNSKFPFFLGRTLGQLLTFEPRGRQHPGHLRADDLPKLHILCRQKRPEGNPDRHPEGGPTDVVFRGPKGLGEDSGEDDCYR